MVLLSLKTNPRNGNRPSVQLDYIIRIEEINPWPPSRTPGAVLIQWEHHDNFRRSRGVTNQVVPLLGRIEFNQSFRLPVNFVRGDMMSTGTFQKNCVEFSLYETRPRDKTPKGQLLGTAFLDLAEHGIVKESLRVRVPVNCKRTYRNSAQPLLLIKIQPVESVSALMSEEYTEEANDDDDDASSLAVTSSSSADDSNDSSSILNKELQVSDETVSANSTDRFVAKQGNSSRFTLKDLSSNIAWISKGIAARSLQSSAVAETVKQHKSSIKSNEYEIIEHEGQQQTEDGPLLGDFDVHKEELIVENVKTTVRSSVDTISSKRNDAKAVHTKGTRGRLFSVSDSSSGSSRILHMERRIKILEGELMEVAANEFSLYSVVAEHGYSTSKVHAPARRLSRLYFQNSNQHKRGTAAKSVMSGLVLVAKACGNDVSRLTFWLSNSIVLRVIVSNSFGKAGDKNGNKKSSPSFPRKITGGALEDSLSDWDNPVMFANALERVEAWIFSRIIESLWWQVFTPRMQSQSGAAKAIRASTHSNQFSLQLWEKAFGDACERICPVRAEGHNCGCLPMLSKLIMEQLIGRLDVAMFNAILRESADEIPTDPIADPISDAEVLPIPTGKASFGAGAQLKNAIGNWSRWLTGLFGIDDELLESEDNSTKSFQLLNALSDIMMLPKDMLLSPTKRKEVCHSFGSPLIRKILNNFVPDEFCPHLIPQTVIESLNSEDHLDSEEETMVSFPCAAAPVVYDAPSSAAIFEEIGGHSKLTRSGSSLLRKSQTSDDELDELNAPLKAIILGKVYASPPSSVKPLGIFREDASRNTVRYKLLQQVWANSE